MLSFDNKEYQTVILAALLHDIGKFMNRADRVNRKHPHFSADYVSHGKFKKIVKEKWLDSELLKTLVQRHHEYYKMPADLKVQTITNQHKRALAYIVSRADSYSSRERLSEEPSELNFKKARLYSVLTRVDIGKGDTVPRYYKLQRLSPEAVFPVPVDKTVWESYDYNQLQSEFGKEFDKFAPISFDALFNGYLSLFEEFLWCVPSDTRDKYSDVSLYDHLSTTSAIAACSYQYHAGNFDESKIKDDTLDKFLLVAGDLSGIQKFIFEVGSTNPKKLSKVLRGRSFYLSLLPEIASFKILRTLHLPITCRIMNAGGRFVLLLPNTEKSRHALLRLKKEIDAWFYERFLGKLTLNLVWDVAISGKDFTSQTFAEKYKALGAAVEEAKKNKFSTIIEGGDAKLRPSMQKAFDSLQRDGKACEFCRIYPREIKKKRCRTCLDSATIGQRIVSKPYLYFYEEPHKGEITILGYSLAFASGPKENGNDWALLECLEEDNEENPGYIKRYISNYIPMKQPGDIELCLKPTDKKSLCYHCLDQCELKKNKDENIPSREELTDPFLTFQCMAASAVRSNSGKGVDHLAVIKADVDDLGFIFRHGLGDAFSISRYCGLSRMMNYFFVGCLKNILKNRDDFRMAYTVYAGGDDLVLIAPWEAAIQLGGKIGADFKAYAGDNPNLTISMGINLMRPASPVKLAVEGAEGLLEKSKSHKSHKENNNCYADKNSLTVFDTTVKWDYLGELEKFMNDLHQALNTEDVGLNVSFLYRLLKYQRMFIEAKNGAIEGFRFHSAMARDVYRNIEKKEKGQKLAAMFLPLYEVGAGFNEKLMEHLKIPVFGTIYKNRGGGK